MSESPKPPVHERWAHLRFSVVGPLLSAPPARGELQAALEELAARSWLHPVTGEPTRFGVSTIERWFSQARRATVDPVGVLRRKVRSDAGQQTAVGEKLKHAMLEQYAEHPRWSYALHYGNLAARVKTDASLGPLPSYASIRRFMKTHGLLKRRRFPDTPGGRRAAARLEQREVRSFEAEYVHGLWHLDFHAGSRPVLTRAGAWVTPHLLGVLDDCSRLACHVQWYLAETARNFVHGLSQAIQKRGLPRALMTDNGGAETAAEVEQGLLGLGIVHELILPYSPYQNAKQEVFWALIEGRLLPMLEGVKELTLEKLNEATLAFVELEYNRNRHSELGCAPIERFLKDRSVLRDSPPSEELRRCFCMKASRKQRRGDGTLSVEGVRFEVPSRFRHLERIWVRYARWDLSTVALVDERTDASLATLYPLNKTKNADGQRRKLETLLPAEPRPASDIAPLLKKLLAEYSALGLPPAYLPSEEKKP